MDWTNRILALRRLARWHRQEIGIIVLLMAGIFAWQSLGTTSEDSVPVVVATRSIPAGSELTTTDLELRTVPRDCAPADALASVAEATGQRITGGLSQGSILTSAAFLDSQWTLLPGEELAPFRISDTDMAALLRIGELINVIATSYAGEPVEVAHQARVVALSNQEGLAGNSQSGTLVVVAVPHDQAMAIANASSQTKLGIVVANTG